MTKIYNYTLLLVFVMFAFSCSNDQHTEGLSSLGRVKYTLTANKGDLNVQNNGNQNRIGYGVSGTGTGTTVTLSWAAGDKIILFEADDMGTIATGNSIASFDWSGEDNTFKFQGAEDTFESGAKYIAIAVGKDYSPETGTVENMAYPTLFTPLDYTYSSDTPELDSGQLTDVLSQCVLTSTNYVTFSETGGTSGTGGFEYSDAEEGISFQTEFTIVNMELQRPSSYMSGSGTPNPEALITMSIYSQIKEAPGIGSDVAPDIVYTITSPNGTTLWNSNNSISVFFAVNPKMAEDAETEGYVFLDIDLLDGYSRTWTTYRTNSTLGGEFGNGGTLPTSQFLPNTLLGRTIGSDTWSLAKQYMYTYQLYLAMQPIAEGGGGVLPADSPLAKTSGIITFLDGGT